MYLHIKNIFRDKSYSFNPLFGFLFVNRKPKKEFTIKDIQKNNLTLEIDNPFKIYPLYNQSSKPQLKNSFLIKTYAKLLIWLYKHCYILLYMFSHCRFKIFDNAITATDVFCDITGYDNQNNLCLPRSIFAATTSKLFKKSGFMIIGVFLPSHQMHAWVIEENKNCWRKDYKWINYSPVAVMV